MSSSDTETAILGKTTFVVLLFRSALFCDRIELVKDIQ